jgi:hypothetical protein
VAGDERVERGAGVVQTGLEGIDWTSTAISLTGDGWVRLEGSVNGRTCARLVGAAPTTWHAETETIGNVSQSSLSCGVSFDRSDAIVRHFGLKICDSLTKALPPGTSPVPNFNVATWNKSQNGIGYITAHRDPPAASGVIAIVTLWGQARFRVWGGPQPTEWITGDGDLVMLRGNGWPTENSVCPAHEAESPVQGDRMIMTLRYNRRGPDADYF